MSSDEIITSTENEIPSEHSIGELLESTSVKLDTAAMEIRNVSTQLLTICSTIRSHGTVIEMNGRRLSSVESTVDKHCSELDMLRSRVRKLEERLSGG